MIRIILQYLLPFLLPFIGYGIYLLLNRHARDLSRWPYFTLTALSVALGSASLIYWAFVDGSQPGQTYVPPQYIDGEIVPGGFVGDEPEQPGG